jgi:hypothetical protein
MLTHHSPSSSLCQLHHTHARTRTHTHTHHHHAAHCLHSTRRFGYSLQDAVEGQAHTPRRSFNKPRIVFAQPVVAALRIVVARRPIHSYRDARRSTAGHAHATTIVNYGAEHITNRVRRAVHSFGIHDHTDAATSAQNPWDEQYRFEHLEASRLGAALHSTRLGCCSNLCLLRSRRLWCFLNGCGCSACR